MYIYHLPHAERRELCTILDQNNNWEELGGTHMQYSVLTMQSLRREIYRGNSPTDELLTLWGQQNHTVLDLFYLLSLMKHYQAMTTIKKFVDPKFHWMIKDGHHTLPEHLSDENRRERRASTESNNDRQNNSERRQSTGSYHRNESSENNGRRPSTGTTGRRSSNEMRAVNAERRTSVERRASVEQKPVNVNVNSGDEEKILNVKHMPTPLVFINGNEVSREDNATVHQSPQVLKPRSPLFPERILTGTALTHSAISYVAESAGAIPQIPYEDLQRSTNNWDKNTVLGKGGFGTVFKGTWKCTKVAIKRIESKENNPESQTEQIKQSITELHCLNAYRHDNILPLYGYSIGGPQPCLVYQYMSGGSLDQRLRIRDPAKVLSWASRLNIAIGTARGLQYLHTIGEKPLIHGDIKSANILLDPNDTPRIGDFGLAREGPHQNYTHITVSRIHGTRPYLPDEFLRAHKFSTKVDTYSFGVVLFEIATSLYAYAENRENKFLKDHVVNYEGDVADLMDKRADKGGADFCRALINIGKQCVNKRPKDRPEMVNVLISLEAQQP